MANSLIQRITMDQTKDLVGRLALTNNYQVNFNNVNNTNMDIYQYLPEILNTYKKNINSSKIIIIYILYISLIKQLLYYSGNQYNLNVINVDNGIGAETDKQYLINYNFYPVEYFYQ